MNPDGIREALRFYFITDDGVDGFTARDQVRVAIEAGANAISYTPPKSACQPGPKQNAGAPEPVWPSRPPAGATAGHPGNN